MGAYQCEYSIDSHLMAQFTHVNLIEIEEGKLWLRNREFKISIFHFYFSNIDISVVILCTLMKILKLVENIQL